MGKLASIFHYITLMHICQQFGLVKSLSDRRRLGKHSKLRFLSVFYVVQLIALVVWAMPVNAGVNDFYFDDFTGDYYLSRDEAGISHLRVRESVTAVFPDFNQNKGICRQIPFTNQGGANITLPTLTAKDITVTRNGVKEPIYSLDKESDYYSVCTGTEEYVLGRQTYVFEYEFDRVVTDFDEYQELYWDTNGNGATQKFGSVTARVHFAPEVAKAYTGEAWCYVGKYGANGQERCEITEISDGVQFVAENLTAHENLTFDVELAPGAFVVPAPRRSYVLVWLLVAIVAACVGSLYFPIKKYVQTRRKRKFYKEYFVRPEYQPHPEYRVAEMAEIYMGKKKDGKTAVLLEMIVQKKVELIKEGEKKRKGWKVAVKSLAGVTSEERELLEILNGGAAVNVGDVIEMKARAATSKLVSLGRSYDSSIKAALKQHGLVTEKFQIKNDNGGGAIAMVVLLVMCLMPAMMVMTEIYEEIVGFGSAMNRFVLAGVFPGLVMRLVMVTVMIWLALSWRTKKYVVRTEKGLAASRYMDGARLYISMAEAERLKFLQSVDGVTTTDEGVVRLYEKMLPYAALLGLEDSWMRELEKYYQIEGVTAPDWYVHGLTVRDLYFASALASSMSRSSTTMSSSGGSSSSGFSGGGGGGFSGGGGGGGGFSGR